VRVQGRVAIDEWVLMPNHMHPILLNEDAHDPGLGSVCGSVHVPVGVGGDVEWGGCSSQNDTERAAPQPHRSAPAHEHVGTT
jgi:hypothetical protein